MDFEKYYQKFSKINTNIPQLVSNFDFEKTNKNFDFYIDISVVNSAQIEGNSLDLNSFLNQKSLEKKFRAKDYEEVSDLLKSYLFAQNSELTEKNLLKAHKISTKTILNKASQGKYRNTPVGIFGTNGLIYLAVEPEFVKKEMTSFWIEVSKYLKEEMTIDKVFFIASFLHLRFAHIHPFIDGNGRMARLLEKWFLTTKLGKKFWTLPSEKFYFENRAKYYENINLGVNFYELDYAKSDKFLKMLGQSLI